MSSVRVDTIGPGLVGWDRIRGSRWALADQRVHLPVRGNGDGDGGLYTTTADVHRFWTALFDHRIVTQSSLRQMLRPRSRSKPTASARRYGLGFWMRPIGDEVMLEGRDAGVSFRSVHDPVAEVTYTVIANSTGGVWPISQILDLGITKLSTTAPSLLPDCLHVPPIRD